MQRSIVSANTKVIPEQRRFYPDRGICGLEVSGLHALPNFPGELRWAGPPMRVRGTSNMFEEKCGLVLICFVLLAMRTDFADGREKPPPGCSISAAYRCDDSLRACEKKNNSVHEEFCQCYEHYTACLVAINPKACMRGAYCYLNDHRCVHFNCAFNAKRCRKCFARTEYDMDAEPEDDILQAFVHHTAISIPASLVFIIGVYVGIGQYRNVKYFDKTWGWDACPHKNFWKLWCCCIMPKKKRKKKKRRKSKKKLLKKGKEKTTELPQLQAKAAKLDLEQGEIEIDLENDEGRYTYSDMEDGSVSGDSDGGVEKYVGDPENDDGSGTGGTSGGIDFPPIKDEHTAFEDETISETSQFL